MKFFKNFFKEDELKLLWPFYLEALINIFFIFGPFYVIYLAGIGLSLFQVGLLISAMAISGIFFEIPTGAIADIYGRKFSTLFGIFLSGLVVILIYFFTNFYALLVLFFFWGLFGTFVSGANEAWIVDLLNYKKKKDLVKEYFVKQRSFISFSMLIAGIFGAFLVGKFGLNIIWLVTGGAMILTTFIFSFGKEHFIKRKQHIKQQTTGFFKHTKKSINYSIQHKPLRLFFISSMIFIFAVIFTHDITFFPFLQSLGFKENYFGYLYSATFVVGIFSPYLSKFLAKKTGSDKRYLTIIFILMSAVLFLIIFTRNLYFVLLIYILFMSLWDFIDPIKQGFFHLLTPSKMRATIGSINGMVLSLVSVLSFPLIGFLADKIGPQKTIFLSSIFLIPAIIIFSKIKEPKNKK